MSDKNNSSSTFQSQTFSSYTDSSGTRTREIFSDPSGTIVQETAQPKGGEAEVFTSQYDAEGKPVEGSLDERVKELEEGDNGPNAGVPVRDEEQERRDAEYLERMEEEYAKREGGA